MSKNETIAKQIYRLLNSYRREMRHFAGNAAVQTAELAARNSAYWIMQCTKKHDRRMLTGFAVCAAIVVGTSVQSYLQTKKAAEVADQNYEMVGGLTETFGNIIGRADKKPYVVFKDDVSTEHCTVYGVYSLDLARIGGMIPDRSDKPVTTFRIPEGCTP